MAVAKKKTTYSDVELEWAEAQLASWKRYIDEHPIHEMKDRIEMKPTARGGLMPMVIASVEAQIKSTTELMQKYLLLLKEVDIMREKEEANKKKVESRGDQDLSPMETGDI